MKRLVFCAVLLGPALAWAKRAPSLPVMQFEARNGADARQAALATDAAAESLRDLDVFKVISSDDIKKILAFQRNKALLSGQCNEDECLAEIGGALGADDMVSGKVTKLGAGVTLELQLFNNARAKVDNAVSQDDIQGDQALVEAAKRLARRVVAPILEKNSGQLFVNVTDPGAAGATVAIDDKVAGITVPPGVQPAPIVLGWGPHHVRVKKDGFLTFEKDIQVDEKQSTTLVVTLVPSPDFISAYKSRNTKLRVFAYITAGLAVAGGAYALEQNDENIRVFKAYDAYRQFSTGAATGRIYNYTSDQDACAAMVRLTGSPAGTSCSDASTTAYNQGSSQLTRIEIVGGLALASAAASVTLWLVSDNPRRYDSFVEANPAPQADAAPPRKTETARLLPALGLSPLPGGVYSSLGWKF